MTTTQQLYSVLQSKNGIKWLVTNQQVSRVDLVIPEWDEPGDLCPSPPDF